MQMQENEFLRDCRIPPRRSAAHGTGRRPQRTNWHGPPQLRPSHRAEMEGHAVQLESRDRAGFFGPRETGPWGTAASWPASAGRVSAKKRCGRHRARQTRHARERHAAAGVSTDGGGRPTLRAAVSGPAKSRGRVVAESCACECVCECARVETGVTTGVTAPCMMISSRQSQVDKSRLQTQKQKQSGAARHTRSRVAAASSPPSTRHGLHRGLIRDASPSFIRAEGETDARLRTSPVLGVFRRKSTICKSQGGAR